MLARQGMPSRFDGAGSNCHKAPLLSFHRDALSFQVLAEVQASLRQRRRASVGVARPGDDACNPGDGRPVESGEFQARSGPVHE